MPSSVLLRTQGKNQLAVAAADLNVSLTAELESNNASDGAISILGPGLAQPVADTAPVNSHCDRGGSVSILCRSAPVWTRR